MKKLYAIFVTVLLASLCQFAFAAPATVSGMTGTAQAIPGAGAPRNLRIGDDVNQGETVSTGDNSTLVLLFEDGQVVGLTARSRMTVSAYTYNKTEPEKSNVLLSLLGGGMRAVTGLIGKANPSRVGYRAGNATIGIRGTTTDVATDGKDVVVTVVDGVITFTANGQTVTLGAGEGATVADGKVTKGTAKDIIDAVKAKNPALGAQLEKAKDTDITEALAKEAAKKATAPATTGTPPGTTGTGIAGSGTGSGGGPAASGK